MNADHSRPSLSPHPTSAVVDASNVNEFLHSKSPNMRKTRIVLLSDTHNSNPSDGQYRVPEGDVLIHAGDMTNQGTKGELVKTVDWISKQPHEVKIVVAGNHDMTLHEEWYEENKGSYHNQYPQSHKECLEVMKSAPGILYLDHEAKEISLRTGPRTKFKVFGSPWSPYCGLWAFGYPHEVGEEKWKPIPDDTDILITHGPPKFHLDSPQPDSIFGGPNAGCDYLRQALWRVQPKLHVFGHIHESRGVERVRWDHHSKHIKYREHAPDINRIWMDPGLGSNKKSLCDVSSSTDQFGKQPLEDGETLLVNAAIMATRSRKNKPIIVYLDLPAAD